MAEGYLNLTGAIAFAAIAHEGQERMNGEPYIVHPLRVMLVVSRAARIPAVLHDALEDYGDLPPSLDPIHEDAIELLTRDKRNQTYMDYVEEIAEATGEVGRIAREVKVADIRDNLSDGPFPISRISLIGRYKKALRVIQMAEEDAGFQDCRFCGASYGFGECCPDCREKCVCPWEHGIGPSLKCPIHGVPPHRLPLFKGRN